MSFSARVRTWAGRAGRVTVARLAPRQRTRLLALARRRLGRWPLGQSAWIGPVSLVVVVEAVDEPLLSECLDSLRAQTHQRLEVVVVPVGNGVVDLASVEADHRFTVLPASRSWYDAANAGARAARGDLLGFVRGCDTLLPHAVIDLGGALAGSGSDLATGRMVQRGQVESWTERAEQAAHATALTGVPPSSVPELAGSLGIAGVLVRTRWWSEHGLTFTDADSWLVGPTLAAAYTRARRVDVVCAPVYRYAHEHGRRAFGAMPSPLAELEPWRQRVGLVNELFSRSQWYDAWQHHLLDLGLPRFLSDAERATEAQWTELVALAREFSEHGAGQLCRVSAASRALVWLAVQDRRRDVEALALEQRELGDQLRTRLIGDRLHADWASVELADEITELSVRETPLLCALQRSFVHNERLVADLFTRIRHLDVDAVGVEVTAARADGGPIQVVTRADSAANRWAQSRFQSVTQGSIRVLVSEVTGPGPVTITMRAGGLSRQASVDLSRPAGDRPLVAVAVDGLALDGDRLVVTATGDLAGLRIRGPGGEQEPSDSDGASCRFQVTADHEGRSVWLASGRYLLTHPGGVGAAAALLRSLPRETLGSKHLLRVVGETDGGIELRLEPPLAEAERGALAQEILRASYASPQATNPRLVYADSYAGRSATDSPLAIVEELLRRDRMLDLCWGVQDHHQWVPEGVRPVLIRSREWYDTLARAAVVVTNTEVEAWWVRRPGQYLVQTFHGYPSKAMGLMQWQARQLPPSQIEAMRRRSVDSWDLILTPSPQMTEHYREQYSYRGAAHEHGYPRDDALIAPTAAQVRVEVRSRLGIGVDQRAILYAPTWRDHLATRPRAAEMAEHLDLPVAAEALGEQYVVLLRGHRFHQPERVRTAPGAARLVDVTAYPEVNDLILACDAAVLDYSSIRFDLGLVRRPMVFLVPDLEDYAGDTRGFLYPFTDSAPGPLVRDTDGVVAHLLDLDRLAEQWAGALTTFNGAYQAEQDGLASRRVVDLLLAGPLRPGGGSAAEVAASQ